MSHQLFQEVSPDMGKQQQTNQSGFIMNLKN